MISFFFPSQSQIASGSVPGVPGRDYPVNSLSGLRRRLPGILPAPEELITPDFPGLKQAGRKQQQQQRPVPRRRQQQQQPTPSRRQQQQQQQPQSQPTSRRQQQQQQQPQPQPASRRQQQTNLRRTQQQTPRQQEQQQPAPTRQQQQPRASVPTIPRTHSEPVQIFNGRYCPGNNINVCMDFCPREEEMFAECAAECRESC